MAQGGGADDLMAALERMERMERKLADAHEHKDKQLESMYLQLLHECARQVTEEVRRLYPPPPIANFLPPTSTPNRPVLAPPHSPASTIPATANWAPTNVQAPQPTPTPARGSTNGDSFTTQQNSAPAPPQTQEQQQPTLAGLDPALVAQVLQELATRGVIPSPAAAQPPAVQAPVAPRPVTDSRKRDRSRSPDSTKRRSRSPGDRRGRDSDRGADRNRDRSRDRGDRAPDRDRDRDRGRRRSRSRSRSPKRSRR